MANRPPLLPRPLHLSPSFVRRYVIGAAVSILAGLGALVAYPILAVKEARGILADQAVWQTGVVAADAQVKGHETSRQFVLNSYELTADYTDEQGRAHHGTTKFDALFASVDQKGDPLELRYDPQAPDRFALSWAINLATGRWASAIGFFGVVGLGLAGVFLFLGFGVMKRVREAREAAVQSDEIEVELVGMVEMTQYGRKTGQVKYRYRVQNAAGRIKQREALFNHKKGQRPLFVDAAKTRMFALVPPGVPDRPIVLRDDLYPYEAPGWNAQTVAAQLERRERAKQG